MTISFTHLCSGTASKRLYPVEIQPKASNQHEFNGIKAIQNFLGHKRKNFACSFFYIKQGKIFLHTVDEITWYEARDKNPERSEYRLYFHDNEVVSQADIDDILITALGHNDHLVLLIIDKEDPALDRILISFGCRNASTKGDTRTSELKFTQESDQIDELLSQILIYSGLKLDH